ncbi:leucine-rich melanocyte differentiation-associated protein-like [Balamuthia mandrillaris]
MKEQYDEIEGAEGATYSPENQQLSVVGKGLASVPAGLAERYGSTVRRLDLSHNALTDLSGLKGFSRLDSLVLDCNQLSEDPSFPSLPSLRTLCANDNNIEELEVFLEKVEKALPSLTYLSLLKNPCCPNYFTGKDQEDYQRYRYFVIYKLQGLKFLDSSAVTDTERQEAKRVGKFVGRVARPAEDQYNKPPDPTFVADESLPALPADLRPVEPPSKAYFGKSKYVYYGRQSEGNRFILNDDL